MARWLKKESGAVPMKTAIWEIPRLWAVTLVVLVFGGTISQLRAEPYLVARLPAGDVATGPTGNPVQLTWKVDGGPELDLIGFLILDCDFGQDWDRDFDSWPDGWTRTRGPEYPRFPKVYIAHNQTHDNGNITNAPPCDQPTWKGISDAPSLNNSLPSGTATEPGQVPVAANSPYTDRGLWIIPEGGRVGLSYFTPPQPIFDYLLEVMFHAEGFLGTVAGEIALVDPDGKRILCKKRTYGRVPLRPDAVAPAASPQTGEPHIPVEQPSLPQSGTLRVWLSPSADSVSSPGAQASVQIHVDVIPHGRSSCEGAVRIKQVRLWRLPRATVQVVPSASLVPPGGSLEIKLDGLWIGSEEISATGRLIPQEGQAEEFAIPVARRKQEVISPTGATLPTLVDHGAHAGSGAFVVNSPPYALWSGTLVRHSIPPGFYWLLIEIKAAGKPHTHQVARPITVLPNLTLPPSRKLLPEPEVVPLLQTTVCQFGWSLPPSALRDQDSHFMTILGNLAPTLVRWELTTEELSPTRSGTGLEASAILAPLAQLGHALLVTSPVVPHSDPIARWTLDQTATSGRGSGTFRFVQLGDERYPPARTEKEAVEEIARLGRSWPADQTAEVVIPFGANSALATSALAFGNRSGKSLPAAGFIARPAARVKLPTSPPSQGKPPAPKPEKPEVNGQVEYQKILLTSWPEKDVSEDASAAGEMLKAMCEAASSGASYFFLRLEPSLLGRMITPEGEPLELFLPWHLGAKLLDGCQYVGPFPVDEGAEGRLFTSRQGAILVAWGDQTRQVYFSLPEGGLTVDAGGKIHAVDPGTEPVPLTLKPSPTFVVSPSLWPMLWQKDADFQPAEMAPLPGRPQRLEVCFRNPTGSAVAGRVRFRAPDGFRIWPSEMGFQLKPSESFRQPVEIAVSATATGNHHQFAWEWLLEQPQTFKWTIYRRLKLIWPGLEIHARWKSSGAAGVVHIELVNGTNGEVHLVFEVFSPKHKRVATPPKVFGPGRHHVQIPCEFADVQAGSEIVLQVRDVEGPRRMRLPVERIIPELPEKRETSEQGKRPGDQ
ncbi:MAG: hypothetical protein NZ899_00835 [Thermoguttaceae bacterium]|nr:hypothetical protein [Thermoguttaceae bacterium]